MRRYSVPALEKTVAILELLAASDRELSVTEIHAALGVPKATIFMLLSVLHRYRVVKKNAQSRYTLGVKLYELGTSYISKIDIVRVARPHLEQLTAETKLTSHLGVIYDRRMMFIDKVEPKSFVRFSTSPGMRADIHISSLGKSIAAHLPEDELMAIVGDHGLGSYTTNTITDVEQLRHELETIRRVGYATENEEGEIGVRCVGSPVFDRAGQVEAAVSLTGLVSQIPVDAFPHLGMIVRATADQISRELGFADASRPIDTPPLAREAHASFGRSLETVGAASGSGHDRKVGARGG
jgi:DNA-binding IclR family transcriptional regulator